MADGFGLAPSLLQSNLDVCVEKSVRTISRSSSRLERVRTKNEKGRSMSESRLAMQGLPSGSPWETQLEVTSFIHKVEWLLGRQR